MEIRASLACNAVNGLEYHSQRAKIIGASDHQIQTALGIARSIKKEAVVEHLVKTAKLQADDNCGNGCGCQHTDNSQMSKISDSVTVDVLAKKETEPQSCGCALLQ